MAVLPSPAVAANDTGSPAFRLRAQANSRSQSLMRCAACAQCKITLRALRKLSINHTAGC
jgi:hypothetical protein